LGASNLDPRYVGFLRSFNEGRYFEAHEVLEDLWLEDRQSPDYGFYKGLIQFAGAFVHLQKQRLQPAASLLRLAIANLQNYPDLHHALDTRGVVSTLREWLRLLEATGFSNNPLQNRAAPCLVLERGTDAPVLPSG
jgi:predicted metal-dependent hydrolase